MSPDLDGSPDPERASESDRRRIPSGHLRRRKLPIEAAVEKRRTRKQLFPQWFFEMEREASHLMARHVLPWIPWTHIPYGLQLRRRLTLSESDVAIENLPPAWDGVRVLLLTDLHAGPFISSREFERTFDLLTQSAQPDMILIAGDIVSSRVQEFRDLESALASLSAPLGTWAVLGNHDHYTLEPSVVLEDVERCGIPVLHNRSVRVEHRGEAVALLGVDDLDMGQSDLAEALSAAAPEDTKILLSHNPDIFFDAARAGIDLVVAGHTHGGQIRFPGRKPPMMASKFPLVNGHYVFEGRDGRPSQLLLSEGLGVVGLPLRITCTPEAVLFVLRRGRIQDHGGPIDRTH